MAARRARPEIEASLWSRECHGRDRVDSFDALSDRTRAWTARRSHETEDHLAVDLRQGAARLPLQTAEHYVAVEALVRGGRRHIRVAASMADRTGEARPPRVL